MKSNLSTAVITFFMFMTLTLMSTLSHGQKFFFEDQFVNDTNENTQRQGPWVIFAKMRNVRGYQPNDVYQKGSYNENKKTGTWVTFCPNGEILNEITYLNGEIIEEK